MKGNPVVQMRLGISRVNKPVDMFTKVFRIPAQKSQTKSRAIV